MNIALVILRADPALGGAELYTINLARSLLTLGHQVSFIAQTFGQDLPPAEQVVLAGSALTRRGQYLRFLDALDEHLAGHCYDIVHASLPVRRCDIYHPHAGLAVEAIDTGHLRYAGAVRRRLSQWGNRLNRKRLAFAAVERHLLQGPRPPITLCLTDAMRQSAVRYFPTHPDRIRTLYYGIDLERFDPDARPDAGRELRQRLSIAPDRIIALTVAQDFERKGLAESIRALAQINDDRLILLVVGRDKPAWYQGLAARLGVSHRVVFAGPTRDVYPFYRAADVFLFPSRVEPCGLVVMEAAAMGVPVIVSRATGASELITEGREGFIVDHPQDPRQLAEPLRRLLNPGLRQEMRAFCLALRPALSQVRHLTRLLEIYQAVRPLTGGGSARGSRTRP